MINFPCIQEMEIIKQQKQTSLTELAWKVNFIRCTPNGILLETNSLFNSLKEGNGITLVHITPNSEEIIESEQILASGGCMGASIYATPLRSDGTIHNLTKFILEDEFRLCSPDKTPITLALHIPQENFKQENQIQGIDYLQIGEQNHQIFNEFFAKDYLDQYQKSKLKDLILGQIELTKDFLEVCHRYELNWIKNTDFFNMFERNANFMPILRYAYFETLQEYILLYQNDCASKYYKDKGEFYNKNFKQMIFELSPELKKDFKITNFLPKIQSIAKYLENKSQKGQIIINFSKEQFYDFFKWRLAQTIRHKFLDGKQPPKVIDYYVIENIIPSLIGQISYRLLREQNALDADLFQIYEELRAKKIWKYWNNKNIICPFNSIIPKGEVGLNPAYPSLTYSIYLAQINNDSGKLILKKRINANLTPKLVPKIYAALRGNT